MGIAIVTYCVSIGYDVRVGFGCYLRYVLWVANIVDWIEIVRPRLSFGVELAVRLTLKIAKIVKIVKIVRVVRIAEIAEIVRIVVNVVLAMRCEWAMQGSNLRPYGCDPYALAN